MSEQLRYRGSDNLTIDGENMTEKLLAAEDVAAILSTEVSWVYRAARRNEIPHVRLGRYVRFREESVRAWVEREERGPGETR